MAEQRQQALSDILVEQAVIRQQVLERWQIGVMADVAERPLMQQISETQEGSKALLVSSHPRSEVGGE